MNVALNALVGLSYRGAMSDGFETPPAEAGNDTFDGGAGAWDRDLPFVKGSRHCTNTDRTFRSDGPQGRQ